MTQVFVSYSRKDLSFVERMVRDLTRMGLDVWYDLSGLDGGERWGVEIQKAIKECECAIVVLSPDSIVSEWVEREFLYASKLKKRIIPLMYRECELPFNYLNLNYIDVQDKAYERNFPKIFKAIEECLPPSQAGRLEAAAPVSSSAPFQFAQSTALKYIIGGAAVAILGLIFFLVVGLWLTPTSRSTNPTAIDTEVATATMASMIFTDTPLGLIADITPTPALPMPNATATMPPYISQRDGMVAVYVPAGEFTMGSAIDANKQPLHRVNLDAFWIDQTEVTNRMYALCVNAGGCMAPSRASSYSHLNYYGNTEFNNYPVMYVDWNQARTYCEWAGRRLPTEAEWEKAARGNDGRAYPWGNDFDCHRGNFDDENQLNDYVVPGGLNCDGYADVAPVGSYPPGQSVYGALDMAGNVYEWVNDWYGENYYLISPPLNPLGPDNGEFRVLRGGSWEGRDFHARSDLRAWNPPNVSSFNLGFRCAVTRP